MTKRLVRPRYSFLQGKKGGGGFPLLDTGDVPVTVARGRGAMSTRSAADLGQSPRSYRKFGLGEFFVLDRTLLMAAMISGTMGCFVLADLVVWYHAGSTPNTFQISSMTMDVWARWEQ